MSENSERAVGSALATACGFAALLRSDPLLSPSDPEVTTTRMAMAISGRMAAATQRIRAADMSGLSVASATTKALPACDDPNLAPC